MFYAGWNETFKLFFFCVCVKYRSMLCFSYLLYKRCFPCFSNIMFWCPLILKQQTLKIIILVTIDNNLYGSWIFKLCHTGDINMHIYLTKKKERKKERKKKPKRSYEICCPANNRDALLETFLCKCYRVSL